MDILETLDSEYGNIENKEQLLEDFYSASQRDDEDVSTWSNRLEEIIGKGLEREFVKQSEVNSMLHGKLWMGLREDLKDVSGHKYDTIKDFNKLRIALRQIEKDHKKQTKPNTSKAAIASPYEDELSKLTGMVNQLTQTVTELQGQQQYQPRGQDQFEETTLEADQIIGHHGTAEDGNIMDHHVDSNRVMRVVPFSNKVQQVKEHQEITLRQFTVTDASSLVMFRSDTESG